MTRLARCALMLALVATPGCDLFEEQPCTPTAMVARRAERVVLRGPRRSARLTARLTTAGAPLQDSRVRFEVLDGDELLHSTGAVTGADGRATADLSTADVYTLESIARGDTFVASYHGEGSDYCPSSAQAAFSAV